MLIRLFILSLLLTSCIICCFAGEGQPETALWNTGNISGRLFIDRDLDKSYREFDTPLGAIEVEAFEDLNQNGLLESHEPRVASGISNSDGTYSLEVFPSNAHSQKVIVNQSSDDAVQNEPGGIMDLGAASMSGVREIGLRFTGLNIPQGATIQAVNLKLRAATATAGITEVIIKAQDADNAPTFQTTNYDLYNRQRTESTHSWISTVPVVPGSTMMIGGFEELITEVTSRDGWQAGNALVLIIADFNHQIYGFDGGYAPELSVSWVDENQQSVKYIVRPVTEDLAPENTFTTALSRNVTLTQDQTLISEIDFGVTGTTSHCFASSGDQYDGLHIINRFTGKNKFIGSFGGEREIKAIAMNKNADILYAVDGNAFGTVNIDNGTFTAYGQTLGSGNGSLGLYQFTNISGLHYDLTRSVLWATETVVNGPDLLTMIDPVTGSIAQNTFGPGTDYLLADDGSFLEDIDDISVHPVTGQVYVLSHNDHQARLVRINPADGSTHVIQDSNPNYLQGLTFHNDGTLYATTGTPGTPGNVFYKIDINTGAQEYIGYFKTENDFEGCDCKTDAHTNYIRGTVFHDIDENAAYGQGDEVKAGIEVSLYHDIDGDGIKTLNDVLLGSTLTDAEGVYILATDFTGDLLVLADISMINGAEWTTPSLNAVHIEANGSIVQGNELGYKIGAVLTATAEDVLEGNISVWPNPATGPVVISLPSGSTDALVAMTVYNVAGSVVSTGLYTAEGGQRIHYDFSGHSKGTYVLSIDGKAGHFVHKVIHQ